MEEGKIKEEEEEIIEIIALLDPKSIPLGVEESLPAFLSTQTYLSPHSNRKLTPKVTFTQTLENISPKAKIWIVNPALFAKLKPTKEQLEKVRWIQGVFAGMNIFVDYFQKIYKDDETLPFRLTRLGGAFGKPMAEWTLGQIIAHERHFNQYQRSQSKHEWKQILSYRTLDQITIGIIGYGEIGREVAKRAKGAFDMKVLAYKRSPPSADQPADPFVDQIYSNIDDILPLCDYILNILPSTSLTRNFFSRELMERALSQSDKPKVFINIGRGDVISDDDLLFALDHRYFHHAILDVFNVEPLPSDHPFWDRADISIIPHVSGVSMGGHLLSLFHSNLLRFINGDELLYLVDHRNEY